MRSGGLLVEIDREQQYLNLLSMKSILDVAVEVSPHKSLNSCKGVVRSPDLAAENEDEALEKLKQQNVTHIQYISINKNGTKKKTNTCIITFAGSTIPEFIMIGYVRARVSTYYPSPLRCFNCQRFGHHRAACKHEAVCALCGMPHPGEAPCTSPKSCANCKGEHAAFDKACPRWQSETKIMKAKMDNNISFPEARKLVEAQAVSTPSISYSAIVKSTRSVSTQTDVSCNCHCNDDVVLVQVQPGTSSASIQTESVAPCVIEDFVKVAQSTVHQAAKIVTKTATNSNKQQPMPIVKNLNKSPNNQASSMKNASSVGSSPRSAVKGNRDSGGTAGRTVPLDRVPKGSSDPIRLYNRYGSLDHMDTIDDTVLPSNGRSSVSSSPKYK
jgi:hypothetical protein